MQRSIQLGKDQVAIEDTSSNGRVSVAFFSYGKKALEMEVFGETAKILYDPDVAFFSATTKKYVKKVLQSYCPRDDIWYLFRKNEEIYDRCGPLSGNKFSIIRKKFL